MKLRLQKLVFAVFLIGLPGLVFAADNDWHAEVGKALGKTGAVMPRRSISAVREGSG